MLIMPYKRIFIGVQMCMYNCTNTKGQYNLSTESDTVTWPTNKWTQLKYITKSVSIEDLKPDK